VFRRAGLREHPDVRRNRPGDGRVFNRSSRNPFSFQRIQQPAAAEAAEGEALVRRVHDAVTVQVCFQIDS